MELEISSTPTVAVAVAVGATTTLTSDDPKSPDFDPNPINQTPPPNVAAARIQAPKPFSTANGVLKRHHPTSTQTLPLKSHQSVVYKECLKNHAATLGGHALDGCGEFMPSPNSVPSVPTSLKCAVCGCHRNFHRRQPAELAADSQQQQVIEYHPHHRHHPPPPPPPPSHPHPNPPRGRSPSSDQSPPPISSSYNYYPASAPSAPHMLLALGGEGGGGIHHHYHNHHQASAPPYSRNSSGRKRFRTKFSLDQKERMLEFAEKVGWRMQKTNDDMVAQFCSQVGVERGVFKVWMHNNKNTYANKRADLNGVGIGIGIHRHAINHEDQTHNNFNNNNINNNGGGVELRDDEINNNNNHSNSNSNSGSSSAGGAQGGHAGINNGSTSSS